ncbi:hypothetical protein N9P07_05985, partial [Alphaproteobacteria bacterium]|nr:hypothetical protein [Alphaproteobacteria bacterium]
LNNSILVFEHDELKDCSLIGRIFYQLANVRIKLSKTIYEKSENTFIVNSLEELETFLEIAYLNPKSFFDCKNQYNLADTSKNKKNLRDIIEETILALGSEELARVATSSKKIETEYFN